MTSTGTSVTIDDLEHDDLAHRNHELIRGELIEVPPAGFDHGDIALAVGTELRAYAKRTGTGRAAGAETGYILAEDPDVMLAPDASFVFNDRLPPRDERRRFLRLAPDLAVEVVSPNDSASYVQRKVIEYLNAGVKLVWIVDPEVESITVYDDSGTVRFLSTEDELDGGEVLPGLSISIAAIFE
jgi:Uma2 family endonuclease